MTLFTLFMSAAPSRTLTFETPTIAELGDPESVSPVPKICDESGGFREKCTLSRRDAACRVSPRRAQVDGQAPSLHKNLIQHGVGCKLPNYKLPSYQFFQRSSDRM